MSSSIMGDGYLIDEIIKILFDKWKKFAEENPGVSPHNLEFAASNVKDSKPSVSSQCAPPDTNAFQGTTTEIRSSNLQGHKALSSPNTNIRESHRCSFPNSEGISHRKKTHSRLHEQQFSNYHRAHPTEVVHRDLRSGILKVDNDNASKPNTGDNDITASTAAGTKTEQMISESGKDRKQQDSKYESHETDSKSRKSYLESSEEKSKGTMKINSAADVQYYDEEEETDIPSVSSDKDEPLYKAVERLIENDTEALGRVALQYVIQKQLTTCTFQGQKFFSEDFRRLYSGDRLSDREVYSLLCSYAADAEEDRPIYVVDPLYQNSPFKYEKFDDLDESTLIMLPRHDNIKEHWALIVFDRKINLFTAFDDFPDYQLAKEDIQKTVTSLKLWHEDSKIELSPLSPQGPNGKDCGTYVIYHALQFSNSWKPDCTDAFYLRMAFLNRIIRYCDEVISTETSYFYPKKKRSFDLEDIQSHTLKRVCLTSDISSSDGLDRYRCMVELVASPSVLLRVKSTRRDYSSLFRTNSSIHASVKAVLTHPLRKAALEMEYPVASFYIAKSVRHIRKNYRVGEKDRRKIAKKKDISLPNAKKRALIEVTQDVMEIKEDSPGFNEYYELVEKAFERGKWLLRLWTACYIHPALLPHEEDIESYSIKWESYCNKRFEANRFRDLFALKRLEFDENFAYIVEHGISCPKTIYLDIMSVDDIRSYKGYLRKLFTHTPDVVCHTSPMSDSQRFTLFT